MHIDHYPQITTHESINDQRACQQPQILQCAEKEKNPTANKVQNG